MSSTYDFNVTLYRDSLSTPWGFRMDGGRDFYKPLSIQRVIKKIKFYQFCPEIKLLNDLKQI